MRKNASSRPVRSALATWAMWMGMLGIGPAAILLGHAALWRIPRKKQSGKSRAWTGLILGYLFTALIIWQWDHLVTSWYYLQDIIDTYRIMQ